MMWDFPKKWLGLVAIIGTLLFLVLENESECRTNAYYNECTREGDRKRVNRKYRIQRNRKEQL